MSVKYRLFSAAMAVSALALPISASASGCGFGGCGGCSWVTSCVHVVQTCAHWCMPWCF